MVKAKKWYKINMDLVKIKALLYKLLISMSFFLEKAITKREMDLAKYFESKPVTGEMRKVFLSDRLDMVI